ncbi:FKBP-type peptidyl-prolyl cis-trans isomerase [Mucilaginibacter sp.]|uniref:FKBP-type peptidyl-prolyl cis-trans isomerase n=1 Tax=Mucilaginibacter sp. TaxID=1882438 RepID=UPI00261DF1C4|nr:FKBP-type peptidyl-prolyl cis-trans isomerase [Mucilaginibacter sp.]MDB4924494.1 peptidylprolyl isomerase [Mucilaginibacter sp.]
MKKYFLLFGLFIFALSSCKKAATFDTAAQAATDDGLIQAYLKLHTEITATKDPSGLYYQVINAGTGAHPTDASNITVGYTSMTLDGVALDSRASSYFAPLGQLIEGWRIGLPKIGTGGTILLIVPSGLGYGNTAHGAIPANTVVIFNSITLQGFN